MSSTAVTLFAGPGTLHCAPPLRNGNGNILFNYVIDGTIRTLSNTNSPPQQSFKGLLYVPDLDTKNTKCINLTAPYIPQNATRRTDLRLNDNEHDTIGLAPWVNRECARAYLTASQEASDQALIFYHPESRDSAKPPPADNPIWDLGDDGEWKKENKYPVYAVSGPAGTNLMHQLSQYSGRAAGTSGGGGNGSEAPQSIADCARLYTLIDLEPDQPSIVPGIWVFVLAILGVIVLMLIFAYLALRHVRRKRRESLQRRLVSGEIDLEYLGITRLVVPPHILSALPVYVYPVIESENPREKIDEEKNDNQESKDQRTIVTETQLDSSHQDETLSSILEEITPPPQPPRAIGKRRRRHTTTTTHTLTFSQNTCAICLDDFVPGTSLVRELPCTHIFHPECIDTFLMRDGSTCPVCKHNVLPESFIEEQISGLLARREENGRRLRRYRHREYPDGSPVHEGEPSDLSSSGTAMDWFRAWLRRDYDDERSRRNRQDDENVLSETQTDSFIQRPPPADLADTNRGSEESYDPARREMMQRRAMVLLGTPFTNPSSLSS